MIDEKLSNPSGIAKEENREELSKKKVYDFFAYLVMVKPIGRPCFRFIRVVIDLAIGGVMLMGRKVAFGFLRLSLW